MTPDSANAPLRTHARINDCGVVVPNLLLADVLCCSLNFAAGDVIAARRWAEAVIARSPSPAADCVLETLVLTAICLHVDAEARGNARRDEVARCLEALALGKLDVACLTASPMQFVRYAAAELACISGVSRTTLLRTLCDRLRQNFRPTPQAARQRQDGPRRA